MERRIFVLRDFLYLTVQFRSRGLIYFTCRGEPALAYGFQYSQYTGGIYIGSKLRRIETYLYMALRSQIVYFIRTNSADYLNQTHRVTQMCIMQVEMGPSFKMGNTFSIVYR